MTETTKKTRMFYPRDWLDDGCDFDDKWCNQCQHDAVWREQQDQIDAGIAIANREPGCEILCALLEGKEERDPDDPLYPLQAHWIEDDVEPPMLTNPRCTAFRPIDDEDDVADPRQGDLFERGTKDYRLITFVPGVRRRR
jgi:hypothetical protein